MISTCRECQNLSKLLDQARRERDWGLCQQISLSMSEHVRLDHPEYSRGYGLAAEFVAKAKEARR